MSLSFLAEVVVISASGALSPGPLTAVAAAVGVKKGWKSGFAIALGHMLVELPLVLLIGVGVTSILTTPMVSGALGLSGGVFLLFFGALTIKSALRMKEIAPQGGERIYESPILVGVLLSALNPFFIVWWIGVGSPLVLKAVELWGFMGIAFMYASHVWLDFAWLPLVTYSASLGRFNLKFLKGLLIALSIAVVYFGVDFILNSIALLI